MISDDANPLAEVAFALAMAFFSLMVLMLFAIVHQPEAAAPDTMSLAAASDAEQPEQTEPQILFFHPDGYFNEQLVMINPDNLDPARPVLLAVQDSIAMSDVMAFKQSYTALDIQISALPADLDAAIIAKRN
ncbi:MAG: hypothetical protein HOI92_03860 [Alphaproteobacteria bacterium]|jgi:hypothetical protein|nr:hypothetical protein [Alphaproteobacteria bacterium]MDG2465704.1 hypothetical protein [Alphaproteobacteria bacterium]